jgi:hypothetical protein
MKEVIKNAILSALVLMLLVPVRVSFAGNEDRAGQAGASELLIMPFARSQGWAGANTSCIRGLEAMYLNVAGTAFTQKTQVGFAYTDWLKGSDVKINTFGFTQRVSETGVIGLSVMNMTFGDIDITTVNQPEGGIGKFSPSLLNIGFSYAKAFSNSIYGGIVFKVISESIADNSAQGLSIDAGIQYVTGERENIRFGIALRNVGPAMKFDGDGLTFRGNILGSENQLTVQHRSAKFELPSMLNIGASYDFFIQEDHTITASGTFVSNSFQKDNIIVGLEYNFKNIFFVRGGFHYEEGIFDAMPVRTTAYTGPAAGVTIQVPMKKEDGSNISIDYAYRASNPYQGIHAIGAKISF